MKKFFILILMAGGVTQAPLALHAGFQLGSSLGPPPPRRCKPGQADRSRLLSQALRFRGEIARSAVTRSVESELNALEGLIKDCGFTESQVAATAAQRTRWRAQGRQSEVRRLRNQIEQSSRFGRVYSGDTKRLQEYSRLSGQSSAETEKYIRTMTARGLAKEQRERQSCSAVNLSPRFGSSRHQDGVGWCFAFTAADLMSYKLGKKISAADTAISYFNQQESTLKRMLSMRRQTDYAGGSTSIAVEAATRRGLCRESEFRSEDNGMNGLYTQINRVQQVGRKLIPRACDRDLITVRRTFPGVDMNELNSVLLTSTQTNLVQNLSDRSCNRMKANLKARTVSIQNNNVTPLLAAIDQQLEENNPVDIAINSEVLMDKNASALHRGGHAVLLIGRRYNEATHRCEYLLRNSWGPSCIEAASDWPCANDGKGHVWVSREAVLRTLEVVTYVE